MNASQPYEDYLKSGLTKPDQEFYFMVVGVTLQHLDQVNFTVLVLSFKIGLSERQVNRKVKSLTGMTAGRLIREIRLNEARTLLEEGRCSNIAQVARKVGFKKESYFSKIYLDRFNERLTEYFNS